MQLKLPIPLFFVVAGWAVLANYNCRNTPVPLPSVSPVQDTTGVAILMDSSYIFLGSGKVKLATKYAEKAVGRLMDAGLDSLAESYARPYIVNAVDADSGSALIAFLDRIITQMTGNPKSDEFRGSLLGIKGYVLQKEGRFVEANEVYWSGLKLLPEKKHASKWATMLNNIAQNYNSIGDYKEAVKYADEALQFIEKYRDTIPPSKIKKQTYKNFYALGWANYEQNHTDEAFKYFNAALKLAGNEQSDVLTFLSKCYQEAGKMDSAFSTAQRAIDLWEKQDTGVYVDGTHQLARCYLKTGNLNKSLQLFRAELPYAIDQLGQSHPDCFKILVYIGMIHERLHQQEQALTSFQMAISMSLNGNLPPDPLSNPDVSQLFPESWLMEALNGKSRALQTLDHLKNLKLALESASLALDVKGKLFDIFETDTSKTDIAASVRPLYEMAISQALTLGDTAQAYYFVQHAKAASLREKIASDNAFATLPDSLIDEYNKIRLNVNNTDYSTKNEQKDAFHALEARLQILEDKICQISPSFALLRKPLPPLEPAFISQNLPEDAAVLDFFCGDSLVYAFVVSKNGLKVYQTIPSEDYQNDIKTLRESVLSEVNNKAATALMSSSWSCYQRLLEAPLSSITRQDPAIKRLWIIPDGELHFLPFDVLLTADASMNHGQRMPFLIRKYATGYAFAVQQFFQPSLSNQQLALYSGWGIQYDSLSLMQINQEKKALLAMRNYGPLPKARQEVEAVNQLLGGTVWLDAKAQKSTFLKNAGKFRIFHFAMHAIGSDSSSEASKMVFSPENNYDKNDESYLSIGEISVLPLKADLVVLSACKTANGELLQGEGIFSLGRAFQFAGARSVLMTQWKANDEASFKVIPAFFEQIKAGKSKDIALQQAKIAMLDNPTFSAFRAPVYWACFIISGDMQPIQDSCLPVWKWVLAVLSGALILWLINLKFNIVFKKVNT